MFKKFAFANDINETKEYWKCNKEKWECENFNLSDQQNPDVDVRGYYPDRKSCLSKCNKIGSTPDALLTQIYPYLTSQNISQLHQSSSRFDPRNYKDNVMIKHLYEQKLLNLTSTSSLNISNLIESNPDILNISDLVYKLNLIQRTLTEVDELERKRLDDHVISADVYLIVIKNLNTIIKTLIDYEDLYMRERHHNANLEEREKSQSFIDLIENYTKIFIQISSKIFDWKPYKILQIVLNLWGRFLIAFDSIYTNEYRQIQAKLWEQITNYFTRIRKLGPIDSREYLETLNFSDLLDIYHLIALRETSHLIFSKFDLKVDDIFQNLIMIIIERYFRDDVDITKFWNFIHELISSRTENIKFVLKIFDLWNNRENHVLNVSEIVDKFEPKLTLTESKLEPRLLKLNKYTKFWLTFLIEVLLLNQYGFRELFPQINYDQFIFNIISKYGNIENNISLDPFLNFDITNIIRIVSSISKYINCMRRPDNTYPHDIDIESCKIYSSEIQNDIKYLKSLPKNIFFYPLIANHINHLRAINREMIKTIIRKGVHKIT